MALFAMKDGSGFSKQLFILCAFLHQLFVGLSGALSILIKIYIVENYMNLFKEEVSH